MTTTFKFLKTQDDAIKQLKVPARIYEMRLAAANYRRNAYEGWRTYQNTIDKVYNEIAGTLTQHQVDEYLQKWVNRQNLEVFYYLILALACDTDAEEAFEEAVS
mgnify:CR=1 FL=1